MKIILLIFSLLLISSCSRSFDCYGDYTMKINAAKDKAEMNLYNASYKVVFNKTSETDKYIFFKSGNGSSTSWSKEDAEFTTCPQ